MQSLLRITIVLSSNRLFFSVLEYFLENEKKNVTESIINLPVPDFLFYF